MNIAFNLNGTHLTRADTNYLRANMTEEVIGTIIYDNSWELPLKVKISYDVYTEIIDVVNDDFTLPKLSTSVFGFNMVVIDKNHQSMNLFQPIGLPAKEIGGGKIDDVQVDGKSVVTNKVAKIDLTPYQKTINASNKISADFITTSATKGFVSDTEKNTWNSKQNAITSSNKLDAGLINTSDTAMFVTNTEKSTWNGKQNAITTSSKLDPTLINTSATARFVSDTEKTTWSGKQAALVSGTNIKTINNQSLLGSGDIQIKFDGTGYVTTTKFEELVAQTPTDIKFDTNGNMVLMHDSTQITNQTPLSLGEMKGPITVVNITSPAEAVNGTITAAQLSTLQKSNMNMVMFNHEVFTLMDKGHTEGFLTYSHVGIENDLIYIKTFTITVSTLAWVLNIRPVPKMEYDESTKTLNIVG